MQRMRKKGFCAFLRGDDSIHESVTSISFTKEEGGKVDPSLVCTSHANHIPCYATKLHCSNRTSSYYCWYSEVITFCKSTAGG